MAEFQRAAGVLVVRLKEPRLDAVRALALKEALTRNVVDRPQRVLIDLSNVDFIDSTGLGVLVYLLKLMGEGGRVVVTGAKPVVRRLFEVTKLDTVFLLFDDEATGTLKLFA